MWRLLEDGEIVKAGDEYWSTRSGEDWVLMPESDLGAMFSLETTVPVRRKINTVEDSKTPTNKQSDVIPLWRVRDVLQGHFDYKTVNIVMDDME